MRKYQSVGRAVSRDQCQQISRSDLAHLGKWHAHCGERWIHVLTHVGVAAAYDRNIARHLESVHATFGYNSESQDVAGQ